MAVSKEDILETIANMSVMEVVDLVEAMEEKFGVSAAAAVAVAAPAAGGDAGGAAARVISDFAKENEKLVVKLVSIGGQLLEAGDIKRLADMPTKDQAISMLMSVMNAPLEKLARTLNEVPGKLVRVVAAVRDQKKDAA